VEESDMESDDDDYYDDEDSDEEEDIWGHIYLFDLSSFVSILVQKHNFISSYLIYNEVLCVIYRPNRSHID
jgi:hypothetical protein